MEWNLVDLNKYVAFAELHRTTCMDSVCRMNRHNLFARGFHENLSNFCWIPETIFWFREIGFCRELKKLLNSRANRRCRIYTCALNIWLFLAWRHAIMQTHHTKHILPTYFRRHIGYNQMLGCKFRLLDCMLFFKQKFKFRWVV